MTIQLENICYSYSKNKLILNDINLELNNGVTGLLGTNGAGKSSLMNILATIIAPKSGKYYYNNIDCVKNPFEIRKKLGYLPQNIGFLRDLSVGNYIKYIGLLKGCSDTHLKENIDNVLTALNLQDKKNTLIKELSGGMKQRVGIAQAIINSPEILLLDEPVIGLDPNERNNFNHIITAFSNQSIILFSSHIIEDIENICENIIILINGEVKYYGNILNCITLVKNMVLESIMSRDAYSNFDKKNIIKTKPLGEKLIVRFISAYPIPNGEIVQPTLEDAFIYITKFHNFYEKHY